MDTASEYWIAGIAAWIACGIAGLLIGYRKEADIEGFFYGCLFGPMGVIVAMTRDNRPFCPSCNTQINRAFPLEGSATRQTRCPHCRVDLEWVLTDGHFTPRLYVEKSWRYGPQGEIVGPVSWADLVDLAEKGEISPDTYVMGKSATKWLLAKDVEGLFPKRRRSA